MISLIVAMDRNRVIGKAGGIPWKMPADVAYFKKKTLNRPVIMGKRTFDSIGKALPNRVNIVLTTNNDNLDKSEVLPAANIAEALLFATGWILSPEDEIFVIGGSRVYKETMDIADRLYVTEIDTIVLDGDTFFPPIDPKIWKEVSRADHKSDAKNPHDYSFVIYERRNKWTTCEGENL